MSSASPQSDSGLWIDRRWMRRALALAACGTGWTAPNPLVGCVLVRAGERIGEGYHTRLGGPHAEAIALEQAGGYARGATAYITLEPCTHYGHTSPCVERLIEAGVARVVVAMVDPNPVVRGAGLARLRAAGVEVIEGILESEAEAMNSGFCKRMRLGRPWVTVKLATSLDGRTATRGGESKWITGVVARTDVHRLRHASSALLTGIGTIQADDPAFTVRLPRGEGAHPLRVILDPHLRLSPTARVVTEPGSCLVVTASGRDQDQCDRLREAGVEIAILPLNRAGRLDLHALWEELGRREINSVLVEAGPTLAGAILCDGEMDRLVVYQAPMLLGSDSQAMFSGLAVERMADQIGLRILSRCNMGPDLKVVAVPTFSDCG